MQSVEGREGVGAESPDPGARGPLPSLPCSRPEPLCWEGRQRQSSKGSEMQEWGGHEGCPSLGDLLVVFSCLPGKRLLELRTWGVEARGPCCLLLPPRGSLLSRPLSHRLGQGHSQPSTQSLCVKQEEDPFPKTGDLHLPALMVRTVPPTCRAPEQRASCTG